MNSADMAVSFFTIGRLSFGHLLTRGCPHEGPHGLLIYV
jgi:hypothetical protein